MPRFTFSQIERVVVSWRVSADDLESAIKKWRAEQIGEPVTGISLEGDECTDVFEEWWEDENGKSLREEAAAIIEALDGSPVVGKPDMCACQNCSWTGPAEALKPVPEIGILERVAPGEPMPAGECPECGALCHPVASMEASA